MKALIWVQHLLGIGHVRRAALIARAMTEAGLDVTVASGGFPVAGVSYGDARVVQLPPARAADKSFKLLVTEGDRPLDDAWKEHRRTALLSLADEIRPDILLLETYPFGRRQFRFELLPLLDHLSRGRPSPRRRIGPRHPGRQGQPGARSRDGRNRPPSSRPRAGPRRPGTGAVRSDLPAGRHHPRPDPLYRLRRPGPQTPLPDGDGHGEVIVSVGGGAVGLPLLRAAMEARPLTALADIPWRLLAGPDIPEAEFQTLRTSAPSGVIVERARPDFPELLARCTLSISQAGYNTLMDILQARCRAVVVPFAAGNETEQTDRARLFEARGLLHIADEAGLTAETLATAIARALEAPPPPAFTPALDGAADTARLLIGAAS